MYDLTYIFFNLYYLRYITSSQSDQLPDGLIAQLVEHCTGIVEAMGSNSNQACIFFFRLQFHSCLSSVYSYDDHSCLYASVMTADSVSLPLQLLLQLMRNYVSRFTTAFI